MTGRIVAIRRQNFVGLRISYPAFPARLPYDSRA